MSKSALTGGFGQEPKVRVCVRPGWTRQTTAMTTTTTHATRTFMSTIRTPTSLSTLLTLIRKVREWVRCKPSPRPECGTVASPSLTSPFVLVAGGPPPVHMVTVNRKSFYRTLARWFPWAVFFFAPNNPRNAQQLEKR